ncbi:MAG: hypothetical protein ABIH00_00405 [Armatimonadota bacterium]
MKKKYVFLIIVISLCFVASVYASDVVSDNNTAGKLIGKAVKYMNNLGIVVKNKINYYVVTAQQLDSLCKNSPYVGRELGLYKYEKGRHNIYLMSGIDYDRFMGTCAHEYAHAWQVENCPIDQDDILREGFARWCEIQVLANDGAAAEAQNYRMSADPVYGNGYRLLLKYEDKHGRQGVLDLVKKIHKHTEIK